MNKTHPYDYDLIVIGAGSGGVRAARISAGHCARVALVEKQHLGGTCVNVGCVPKKLLAYASRYSHEFEDCHSYGWSVDNPVHNWPGLIKNKDQEIERLRGIYKSLLKEVDLYTGHGKFVDTHSVEVNDQKITADKILIATGGHPFIPDIDGRDHFVTSDDMFYLEKCPEHLTVYGGGYIATEFACIMRGLGAKVTLVYRGNMFMRNFDNDIRLHLADEMQKQGIDLSFGCEIEKITQRQDGRYCVKTTHCDELETDLVLAATGRLSNDDNLNLKACGLSLAEDGLLKVNDEYQTDVSNIYAVGDVTNKIQLTPLAIAEAHTLADRLFAPDETHKRQPPNYDYIPTAVFTIPEIGTVGMTQDEAVEKYGKENILLYRQNFRAMKFTLPDRDEKTLMKMVVLKDTGRILGMHMCGHDAAETIQGFAPALAAGVRKEDFDRMVGIHPTSGEEFFTMRQCDVPE